MADRPKRIQLSRQKGLRQPEGCVVVARPTKWGNPFHVKPKAPMTSEGARVTVVAAFRAWLIDPDWIDFGANQQHMRERRQAILDGLPELRGKDLACWCPLDAPCHADVLLEMAND